MRTKKQSTGHSAPHPIKSSYNRKKDSPGMAQKRIQKKPNPATIEIQDENYKILVDESADSIFSYKRDGTYQFVNKAFAEPFGKSPDKIIGKNISDLFPKEEAEKRFDAVKWVFKNKKTKIVEFRQSRSTGDLYFITSMKPVFNEKGKVISIICVSKDITERKRIEDTLRESEECYRQLVEISPDAIAIHIDGTLVYVNPAAMRLIGVKKEEQLIGKLIFDVLHPDCIEIARQRVVSIMKDRSVVLPPVEIKILRFDGGIVDTEVFSVPTLFYGKQASQLIVRDITERKRSEKAREQERILLRTLIDNLPSGIFVKDKNYRNLIVNPKHVSRVSANLGPVHDFSEEDLMGKTDFEIFPKKIAKSYFAEDQKVVEGGQSVVNQELLSTDADGQAHWDLISKIPLRNKNDEIIGLVGISNDITERKKAEFALLQSEERYRQLVEFSPDGIAIIHSDGTLAYVNPAAVKITGAMNESQLIGKRTFDVIHPDYIELARRRLDEVMKNKIALPIIEMKIVRLDGGINDVEVLCVPILFHGNQAAQIIIRDISERKHAEKARDRERILLRTLVDNLPNGIFVKDSEYRKTLVNQFHIQAISTQLGCSSLDPEVDILHKTDFDVYPKELAEEYFVDDRKVIEEGQSILNKEEVSIDPNGQKHWALILKIPLRDEEGKLSGMMGITTDITSQKNVQENLQKSKETLSLITNSIDDIIYSIDGQTGEFEYLSPAFERKLGYSLSDIQQMGGRWSFISQVVQYDGAPKLDPILHEIPQKKMRSTPVWDHLWKCKDGSFMFIEDRSVPIYKGDRLVRVNGVLHDITERKKWEIELKESEQRYRRLVDVSPDAIGIQRNGKLVYVNPAAVHLAGANDESELIGKPVIELVHPSAKNIARLRFDVAIKNAKPSPPIEMKLIRFDGVIVYAEIIIVPTLFEEKPATQIIVRDITERKKADIALQESEERYCTLVEGSPDAIGIHVNGKFVYVNSAAIKLTGAKDESQMIGMHIFDFIHPDYKEIARQRLQLVMRDRITLPREEMKIVRFDCEVLDVESISLPTLFHGEPATQVIIRDITERKKVEKEIADTKAILETAFMQTPIPMVLASAPDYVFRLGNSACMEFLGVQDEPSHIGESLLEFKQTWQDLDENGNQILLAELPLPMALRGIETKNREIQVRRKDGTYRWESISASPVRNSAGEIIAGYIVFPDITERKQAEIALQESEDRYCRLVEYSPDAIAVHMEGKFVYVNPATVRILGAKDESQLIGLPVLDIMHPDYKEIVRQRVLTGMRERKSMPLMEEKFIRFDGKVIDAEVVSIPTMFHGKPATQLIARDIMARKAAEIALKQSEQKHRDIFENANEGIFVVQKEKLVFVNPMGIKIIGYPISELLSKPFVEFLHPEDRGIVFDRYRRRLKKEDFPHNYTFRVIRKDGVVRSLDLNTVLIDWEGEAATLNFVSDITEMELAEKARERERILLRTLIDNLPSGVFIKDKEYRKTLVNKAHMQAVSIHLGLLGLNPEMDILGKTDFDIYPKELAEKFFIDDRRVVEKGLEILNQEEIGFDTAGKKSWILVSKIPLRDKDGEITGMVGITTNITTRKIAEDALRESESRYRLLAEASHDMIFVINKKGIIEYTNNFAASQFDLTSLELVGRRMVDIFPSEIGRGQIESITSVFKSGKPLYVEKPSRFKDKVFWLGTWLVPLPDSLQQITSILGISRDITERVATEKALRESEERFRTLITSMGEGIAIVDADGSFLFTNPAMEEIFGVELNGRKISEFISSDQIELIHYFTDVHHAKKSIDLDIEHPNGEKRNLVVTVTPQFDANGIFKNNLGVFRDLTDRKAVETALWQAQKMESIGILAGGIAHDFNNLLNAILGQTSLAASKLPEENPARSNIDKAMTAAERAANLTQQLLAYSGRGKFDIKPLDINKLIHENLHLFELSIPKNVRLESRLYAEPVNIHADAAQIQQITMNLIINASEAIGKRPGTVAVSTSITTLDENDTAGWFPPDNAIETGTYALLEVSDDGSGMSIETKSKIFDPFFTTKFTGRGLGLAAVLGIVRGHKGGLQVESEIGKGSTFRIILPYHGKSIEQRSEPGMNVPLSFTQKTVLVIDDEEPVREIVKDILESAGNSAITTPDGTTGIELFKKYSTRIDFIILDLSMPGMSGKDTFLQLKSINPDVRIILSSGYTEEEATEEFHDLGLVGFIQKPYRADTLLSLLSRFAEK